MSVDLGFETIGNATSTVFDNSIPVLTTDPWIIAADWNNNNKTGYTTNLSSNYSKWDDSFNESFNIINKLIDL